MGLLKTVTFISRNKDNAHVEGFKPRTVSFVVKDGNIDGVLAKFDDFVYQGVVGERSRCYMSVDCADATKVQTELAVKLIRQEVDLTKIDSMVASLASKPEMSLTKRLLLDFDSQDEDLLNQIIKILKDNHGFNATEIKKFRTVNGLTIVLPHNFDSRELSLQYKDILEFKKHAFLLHAHGVSTKKGCELELLTSLSKNSWL